MKSTRTPAGVYGEHLAVARATLQELDEPDLEGVPQELRLFALRGAVVARLGVIALDGIPQEALVARPVVFRSFDSRPVWVHTRDFSAISLV